MGKGLGRYPPFTTSRSAPEKQGLWNRPSDGRGPLEQISWGFGRGPSTFCFCRITLEVKRTTINITLQLLDDSNSQFWMINYKQPPNFGWFKFPILDDSLNNPPSLDDSNSQTFNKKSCQLPFRCIDLYIFCLLNGLSLGQFPKGSFCTMIFVTKKTFWQQQQQAACKFTFHYLFGMSNLVRAWVYVKTWPESQRLVSLRDESVSNR